MDFGSLKGLRKILQKMFGSSDSLPHEMMSVIMQASNIQKWFTHQRGQPMAQLDCKTCAKERIFTIWNDGKYHCLYCLYHQAMNGRKGPVPIEMTPSAMREFIQMWMSFRRCASEVEEVWVRSDLGSDIRLVRPSAPPICQAEECKVCEACRPHVLGAEIGKRCLYCLMKEGLQASPSDLPKRPTCDRLDDIARAAVASLRASQ